MSDSEAPWRNESVLKELRVGKGMTMREIADELGCCAATVWKWCSEYDIEVETETDSLYFFHDGDGYELIIDKASGTGLRVHQLNALIDNDPYEVFSSENHVHHRDGCVFNNAPSNLCLLPAEEHIAIHKAAEQVPV